MTDVTFAPFFIGQHMSRARPGFGGKPREGKWGKWVTTRTVYRMCSVWQARPLRRTDKESMSPGPLAGPPVWVSLCEDGTVVAASVCAGDQTPPEVSPR